MEIKVMKIQSKPKRKIWYVHHTSKSNGRKNVNSFIDQDNAEYFAKMVNGTVYCFE